MILITLLLGFCSCNDTSQNEAKNDRNIAKDDSIKTINATFSDNNLEDSTIYISFPKDSTLVTVRGEMKGIDHPVTVYIPVQQGTQLTAKILPEDSTANIRINQIFTPDGKADGPFGKELKRSLHQPGTYKLVIGENMMQGDEWKGKFKLTIKVE